VANRPPTQNYKRSWKNLLINKRYQLRFTLFMVGLATMLMLGLGWRVMKKASEATSVGESHVLGEPCPVIPIVQATPVEGDAGAAPAAADSPATPPSEVDLQTDAAFAWCLEDIACDPIVGKPLEAKLQKTAKVKCSEYVTAKLEDRDAVETLQKAKITEIKCEGDKVVAVPKTLPGKASDERPKARIQLEESTLTLQLPKDYTDQIAAHWTCQLKKRGELDELDAGRHLILWVLLASGALLAVGLAAYGIKMTHKVAGPLFKITLYLNKMRDGRLDKVYSLRKGDQLVDFYEHFKTAHAGIVAMEKDDIAQLRSVIAAAEAAGQGSDPSVDELRAILARKEKAIE
jgi:hypothetical protein